MTTRVEMPGGGGRALSTNVYRSTNQTFTTGVLAPIVFDTVQFDTLGAWNPATPGQLTLPFAGVYLVTGYAPWFPNGVGGRLLQANVVPASGPTVALVTETINGVTGGFGSLMSIVAPWIASVGDVVIANGQQNSGGNLDLEALPLSFSFPRLAITLLG